MGYSKGVVKNTFILYLRMLLIIVVNLYTVRVVLKTLGEIDYGLFNVVGGIVTMFSVLSATMASASQRFLAFEIGRKNYAQLRKTFSTTVTIYAIIAITILILTESIGLWFLNNHMSIPSSRMDSVRWVFHFSVFSFLTTIITIPYNASIIAHEKMSVYAWVSIAEVILKLLTAYFLVLFSVDKLKLYAVLIFFVTLIINFTYREYSRRKFSECRFSFYWDKNLFTEIIKYSGWNIIGSSALILRQQGVNILLNIFFGPIVNAAHSIGQQFYNIVSQLIQNIYMSSRPQITKLYASNNKIEMWALMFTTNKLAFYLLLIIGVPVFWGIELILDLWLGDYPPYTIEIVRLLMVSLLIETTVNQLISVFQAANKIKKYQIVSSVIILLITPVSYIILRFFDPQPLIPYIISCLLAILYAYSLVVIARKSIALDYTKYLKDIILTVWAVVICSVLPILLFRIFIPTNSLKIIFLSEIFTIISIWFIGLQKEEKKIILNFVSNKIKVSNLL